MLPFLTCPLPRVPSTVDLASQHTPPSSWARLAPGPDSLGGYPSVWVSLCCDGSSHQSLFPGGAMSVFPSLVMLSFVSLLYVF